MGIRGNAFRLIENFLTNRKQCAEITTLNEQGQLAKILSDMLSIRYSVPQRTVIGPFLFLIYINTIEKLISEMGGEAIIHVDDTNVIIRAPNLELAINKALGIMLVELTRTPTRSKRWYLCLVGYMLDVAAVNSWLLYKRHIESLQREKKRERK